MESEEDKDLEEKEDEEEEKGAEESGPKPIILGLVALVVLAIIGAIYYFVVLNKSFKEARDLNAPSVVETMESGEVENTNNAIAVTDYTPGNVAIIDLVALDEPGFANVHEDNNGKPGEVLGVSEFFEPGEYESVGIELDRASEEGETLYAMVYHDDGDGEFLVGEDLPATDIDGEFIMIPFEVTSSGDVMSEEV